MNLKKLLERNGLSRKVSDTSERKIWFRLFDSDDNIREPKGTYNTLRYIAHEFDVCDEYTIYKSDRVSDGVSGQVPEDLMGGIITFSTDVNAIDLSENKIINKIKQTIKTWTNRMSVNSKINNILGGHRKEINAWSVGNFFRGNYQDRKGRQWNEKSISVEIIYINVDPLIKIAEELCSAFLQESVMVYDYANNRVYFVDDKKESKLIGH